MQNELSLIRDHVSAIPTEDVVAELQRSTGSTLLENFAEFDLTPVALASIGQVHRASTTNGRQVAVKVRRPHIRSDIEIDVKVLVALVRVANVSRTIRRYDPMAIADEFSRMLSAESGFMTEAGNIEALGRIFRDDDSLTIPTVLWEHTSESVLVMDWIDGLPLTDALETAEVDRTAMA